MSATAYGKLFIGWKQKDEFLHVQDGAHWGCINPEHVLNGSTAFCPVCGSRLKEVATMVPSPLVAHFADRRGISVEKALDLLSPYQHQLPQYWADPDSGGWILGVDVTEVSSNKWKKVTLEMMLPEVRALLIEAGMPVGAEGLYLAVWLE